MTTGPSGKRDPALRVVSDQAQASARAVVARSDGRPHIEIGSGPETIRALAKEIGEGSALPDTYVADGRVVHVEAVSGTTVGHAVDEDSPLPMAAAEVTPARLAALLAEHTFTFATRKAAKGDLEEQEVTPTAAQLQAVLARRTWPGLKPLLGIVGAPILRRDGTLLQDNGYDPATGLYLASKVKIERVPDRPTPGQTEASRAFLLDQFLHDFPWVGDADRANYVALMLTPIIRPHLRCLTPFGLLTATTPSSGKTILTAGLGLIYGQRIMPWTDNDEELRKAITSVLADQAGVVVFDNLAEGSVVDSPILALLLTVPTWSDRLLGRNKAVVVPNDRLWLATGNNLQVGGDMASRTVLVRLDPNCPSPETRTGFALPKLDEWITNPGNQATLLHHLLVLVADWVAAGAPRDRSRVMRQFSAWAEALGGFLDHHQIAGFLGNVSDVKAADEGESLWGAFLRQWRVLNPDQPTGVPKLTAAEIRASAEPVIPGGPEPWEGTFPTTRAGRLPSSIALGRMLNGQKGRWRGDYVLRAELNDDNRSRYWVETGGAK
jgi:hypothetical protein